MSEGERHIPTHPAGGSEPAAGKALLSARPSPSPRHTNTPHHPANAGTWCSSSTPWTLHLCAQQRSSPSPIESPSSRRSAWRCEAWWAQWVGGRAGGWVGGWVGVTRWAVLRPPPTHARPHTSAPGRRLQRGLQVLSPCLHQPAAQGGGPGRHCLPAAQVGEGVGEEAPRGQAGRRAPRWRVAAHACAPAALPLPYLPSLHPPTRAPTHPATSPSPSPRITRC